MPADTMNTAKKDPVRTKMDTRTMVSLAMLAVIAYVVMCLCKFLPSVSGFLDFDFKHAIICIGGFIFGPASAALVTVVVAFIEMITVGSSQFIGFIMNVLGTASFCCTASYVYQRNRTRKGAVTGLALGMCVTVVVMLLWNYFLIPLYTPTISRDAVAGMMLPVLLPFNLAKSGINMGLTLLLYNPVVTALRAAHLAPPSRSGQKKTLSVGFLLFSLFLLATFGMVALVLLKII